MTKLQQDFTNGNIGASAYIYECRGLNSIVWLFKQLEITTLRQMWELNSQYECDFGKDVSPSKYANMLKALNI